MWKWIIRKKKKLLIFIGLISIFISCLKMLYYILDFNCSFDEVEGAVELICKEYENRDALGDLCSALCESKLLHPVSCLPHHLGKEVVFEAKYSNQRVVVKSSKFNSSDFDQVFWISDGQRMYPSLEVFNDMIQNTIERNLNTNLSGKEYEKNLMGKIWNEDMLTATYLSLSLETDVMNNIWYLIQQTEYLFLKYYESKKIFPRILGTCGHFYVVEYIKPLDNLFLILYPAWRNAFSMRAKLGIKILDYLGEVSSFFPDLHICDVKMGHFGLDEIGNVKFLDMDMVFFKASLIQNMVAVQNCSSDQDCSFIDCKGSCSEKTKVCEPKILNDNFQRVCSNIFSGRVSEKYFGLLGLPPPSIADKLHSLLQKCSAVMNGSTDTQSISNQLKFLLQTVVI